MLQRDGTKPDVGSSGQTILWRENQLKLGEELEKLERLTRWDKVAQESRAIRIRTPPA
jgi:hypothetical protein